MFDHQFRQTFSVDQNDPLRNAGREFNRVTGESRRRDEHPFRGPEAHKTAGKGLDRRAADGVVGGITFGLNIDTVRPQHVLVDHSVNPAITRSPQLFGRILLGTAISHGNKKFNYQTLE